METNLFYPELEKRYNNSNQKKLRRFIEAILSITRSGCQWRLLPYHYGSWGAGHSRFWNLSKKGIGDYPIQSIATEADLEHTMIDATIIRAYACSTGYAKDTGEQEALGRSKGFTSRIHALVDSLGNPLKFILTAGQRNDITQAQNLTQDLKDTILIADKGYDSNACIDSLAANNCQAVIPLKKNRKERREYDERQYKERHLIECFFGKIKRFRESIRYFV